MENTEQQIKQLEILIERGKKLLKQLQQEQQMLLEELQGFPKDNWLAIKAEIALRYSYQAEIELRESTAKAEQTKKQLLEIREKLT